MYRTIGVLLLASFVYGSALPQEKEADVKPEDLDKLLAEKNYKEFARLLGIEDEKFVRPIEGQDDRKYDKSLCVTDFVYTYPRRDNKTRFGRYWPKSGNLTFIPVIGAGSTPNDDNTKSFYLQLLHEWPKNYPQVRFKKYEGEADYVYIFEGPSCFSDIGRRGGPQALSVNKECALYDRWRIYHHGMHVAGFPHEHNRPERNKFITVQKDNLVEGAEMAYRQYLPSTFYVWNFYDYFSITHFSPHDFSKLNKTAFIARDTPELKKNHLKWKNKERVSLYDLIKLHRIYG